MPSLMQANEGDERPPQNQLHVYESSSQNDDVLKAAVHHQHVQPTPYICDMDVLFTRRPDNMHASSESESFYVEGITKQEQDSDSLDPAVVRLWCSTTWSPQVVTRLHFIKRAKQLGFSLKEISELLLLRVDAQTSCDEVRQRTEAKLAEVERKLVELQRMRQALLQVHSLCIGPGPTSACPMLEALAQQETLDPAE